MTGVCYCLTVGGFGFSPAPAKAIVWACNQEHQKIAQRCYGRERELMGEAQAKARAEAGKVAGRYLDRIGKTDLAALTKEEYATFVEAIIETYRDEMTKLCEPF